MVWSRSILLVSACILHEALTQLYMKLEVLDQFLGKAITGLKDMYERLIFCNLSKAKLLTICAESGPKGHFLGKLFFSPPPCRIIYKVLIL